MLRRLFSILTILITSILLVACDEDGELKDDFDPTPYLAQAFQEVTNYEHASISPTSAKWIYTDVESSELSILHLFTSFGRGGETGTFYAMVSIYINKETETLESFFIDRIYYDELGASISSAQGYQELYTAMLKQMYELEDSVVKEGVITSDVIASAMQNVTEPISS